MITLSAAGGVVFREDESDSPVTEILMIYRRGVWDLPKGKVEEGETIESCATREVAEETGIPEPGIDAFLATTYHEYKRDGEIHGKTTYWYAMQVPAVTVEPKPQTEEGIERVEWMGLARALEEVGYDNLKQVLDIFKEWVEQ